MTVPRGAKTHPDESAEYSARCQLQPLQPNQNETFTNLVPLHPSSRRKDSTNVSFKNNVPDSVTYVFGTYPLISRGTPRVRSNLAV